MFVFQHKNMVTAFPNNVFDVGALLECVAYSRVVRFYRFRNGLRYFKTNQEGWHNATLNYLHF